MFFAPEYTQILGKRNSALNNKLKLYNSKPEKLIFDSYST
jgi:hypothetical protein